MGFLIGHSQGRKKYWIWDILAPNTIPLAIVDKPGKKNIIANLISRIHNEGETILTNDNFPHKHLFLISIKSPWFVDIYNYLATGQLPHHFSPKEKLKRIKVSSTSSYFGGDLFCIGPNLVI